MLPDHTNTENFTKTPPIMAQNEKRQRFISKINTIATVLTTEKDDDTLLSPAEKIYADAVVENLRNLHAKMTK